MEAIPLIRSAIKCPVFFDVLRNFAWIVSYRNKIFVWNIEAGNKRNIRRRIFFHCGKFRVQKDLERETNSSNVQR